jgi:hypothetical protein
MRILNDETIKFDPYFNTTVYFSADVLLKFTMEDLYLHYSLLRHKESEEEIRSYLHRLDGPAVIVADISPERLIWWVGGEHFGTEEEFEKGKERYSKLHHDRDFSSKVNVLLSTED